MAGVHCLGDIHLRNTLRLAGFAKRDDLDYLTQTILGAEYVHLPALAPSPEILDAYRANHDWARYERDFLVLLCARQAGEGLAVEQFRDACLLCSEPTPEQCHRRLVAEYLREIWGAWRFSTAEPSGWTSPRHCPGAGRQACKRGLSSPR